MSKISEGHREAAEKVDRLGLYTPQEAGKRRRRRGTPSEGLRITSTATIEPSCG